jgi:hypothetical protein
VPERKERLLEDSHVAKKTDRGQLGIDRLTTVLVTVMAEEMIVRVTIETSVNEEMEKEVTVGKEIVVMTVVRLVNQLQEKGSQKANVRSPTYDRSWLRSVQQMVENQTSLR